MLLRLHAAGLPVPRPVAARYEQSGIAYRADLITEELPDTRTSGRASGRGRAGPDRLDGDRPLHPALP